MPQLVGLPQLYMVSAQHLLVEGLAHVHHEKVPVACIYRVDLVRASAGQKPEHRVALLHYHAIYLVRGLSVQVVGE